MLSALMTKQNRAAARQLTQDVLEGEQLLKKYLSWRREHGAQVIFVMYWPRMCIGPMYIVFLPQVVDYFASEIW